MLLIIFSDNDINDKDTLDLIKIVAILYSTRAFAGLTPVCRARHQKRQPCIVSFTPAIFKKNHLDSCQFIE